MTRLVFLMAMSLWLSGWAVNAGEYNRVLSIGDTAPGWSDLPGVDDRKHSMSDLQDHQVVVVVFTCNSCPYAVDIEDRLVAFAKEYSDRDVALVAINVNTVKEDLLPAMKETAEEKGFKFPYLFDESQAIAKEYGAKYTPEFFVLDQRRKVVYMGSLDDSPDGKAVSKQYVRLATEAALAGGKPEVTETVPIGCRIRFERQRRSRTPK